MLFLSHVFYWPLKLRFRGSGPAKLHEQRPLAWQPLGKGSIVIEIVIVIIIIIIVIVILIV